jgi:hypothetical protein
MIHRILPNVRGIHEDFWVVCGQEVFQQCIADLQGRLELLDQVSVALFWGIAQDR